jgi:uncharacterized protein YggE
MLFGELNMKKKIALVCGLIIIAALLLVSLPGCGTTEVNEIQNQQLGISVSGQGIVTVTPDIATLDLGVTAEASTVVAAQSQVSTAIAQVMAALTSNGVAQKDIQTQNYTIQQINSIVPPPVTVTPYNSSSGTSSSGTTTTVIPPSTTTVTPDNSSSGATSSAPAIIVTSPTIITTITPPIVTMTPPIRIIPSQIMYQVSNTITVTVRTISNTGTIIDAVVAAGGNLVNISSVTLSVNQPDQYYTQARQLAMTNAANEASQLAKSAGVTLGKAISISENDSSLVFPQIINSANLEAASPTSISPGQSNVTVNVQVIYAIK